MFRATSLAMLALGALVCAASDEAVKYLGSGDQFFGTERYAEAVEQYELALRSDPSLEKAREQLAVSLFELREYDRATPLFTQMMTGNGTQRMARYYLGRINLAEAKLEPAIDLLRSVLGPQPFRDEHYYLGSAYYKLERYPQSEQLLRQAIALNPRDFRAHQLLARVYQKTGRSQDAEKEFAETRRLSQYYLDGSAALKNCRAALSSGAPRALETCKPLLDTDDVDKLSAAGVVLGEAQRYPEAKVTWEKAAKLDPDSAEIQYNLALTCFHLRWIPDAKIHAAIALKLRPLFPEASVLYGTVLYMTGADEEALAVLRQALSLRPEDSGVRKLLIEELTMAADRSSSSGNWRQAEQELQEASTLSPDSSDIANRLATVRAQLEAAKTNR